MKSRNRRYCCSHYKQLHKCPRLSTLERNTLHQVLVKKTKTISHEKRHVNRQPLKGKHSANIKENNDEIAKLRNEISDFKELIHTLSNKRDGKYKCVCSAVYYLHKHVGIHYEIIYSHPHRARVDTGTLECDVIMCEWPNGDMTSPPCENKNIYAYKTINKLIMSPKSKTKLVWPIVQQ